LSVTAKKLGEKRVTGLGIGAAASGSYLGGKETYKDIKSLLSSSGKEGSGSNTGGSNPGCNNSGNNGDNSNGKN
jgi:hypothetical protein